MGLEKYSFHFHADTGLKAGSYFSCRHRTSRSLICPCMFKVELILSAGKARIADTPGYRVCAPHVQVPLLAPALGLGLHGPCNAPCDSGDPASLTEHPGQLAAPTSAGPCLEIPEAENFGNFLWREFRVQGWCFLFLNVSSPPEVFFPTPLLLQHLWQMTAGRGSQDFIYQV